MKDLNKDGVYPSNMFDAIRFCDDNGIRYYLEGKNVQEGMVSIQCPFCDDHSNHGAFNPLKGYFTCWKCGFHPLKNAIKKLAGLNYNDINKAVAEYSLIMSPQLKHLNSLNTNDITFDEGKTLVLPGGELTTRAKQYLTDRKFNASYLERKYKLQATRHLGNYKFRIIIPVLYNDRAVSFQGRDYTGKQELRYKDCSKQDAILYHKNIVYNHDNSKNDTVLVVEGVFDTFRLGDNCVATFGTGFTMDQIQFLAKHYKVVRILYDSDPTARKKAESAVITLCTFGIDADLAPEIDAADPAEMSDRDVVLYKRDLKLY